MIIRDITERKRAEEALRVSEKKFATLFRSSPISITVSDLNDRDRFLEVNEAFETFTGHSREGVIGRTYPPDWLWPYAQEYAQAVAQFTSRGELNLFLARQDPNRNDSAAMVLIINSANTATEDQLLNFVAQQFAQDLRVIRRDGVPGSGRTMIADGRAGSLTVRVGVFAVTKANVSIVSLLLAKTAEFDPLGGIDLVTVLLRNVPGHAHPQPQECPRFPILPREWSSR